MRVVMIAGMRTSVCRYGKNCTLTLSWFRCSWVRCQKHINVGTKRFRCAEVLFGTFFCFFPHFYVGEDLDAEVDSPISTFSSFPSCRVGRDVCV